MRTESFCSESDARAALPKKILSSASLRLCGLSPVLVFALACNTTTQTVSALDGTCTACHTNITAAHTRAVIGCVECHGGNEPGADQAAAFARSGAKYGDTVYQQMLDTAHVRPKAGNEDFFLAARLVHCSAPDAARSFPAGSGWNGDD